MYPYDLNYYYACQQSQQQKITKLEEEIANLQDEIKTMKKEPKTTIEKIEYKFDQLKIEHLDGTLHLGLSPNGGEVLDDFSINDQSMNPVSSSSGTQPDMTENIRRNIGEYLSGNALEDLKQIEKEYGYPLDNPYRRFILDDVSKQVDGRIHDYLNNMGAKLNEANQAEIEQAISDKVKADIYQGMVNFIDHLKKGSGGE